jgi:hypothetical protein
MFKVKVPDTISDAQMAGLRRRAEKAAEPMFSPRTVARRLASDNQRRKATLS